jgi:hypothetical protein
MRGTFIISSLICLENNCVDTGEIMLFSSWDDLKVEAKQIIMGEGS